MSTAANKQTVEQFIEAITQQKFDRLSDLMADNGTWKVPGDLVISRTYTKQEIIDLLKQMSGQFASPINFRCTGMIAEDNKVAAECLSSIDTNNGRAYRNEFHFLFEVDNGRISRVVEYCDTKHVQDIFLS